MIITHFKNKLRLYIPIKTFYFIILFKSIKKIITSHWQNMFFWKLVPKMIFAWERFSLKIVTAWKRCGLKYGGMRNVRFEALSATRSSPPLSCPLRHRSDSDSDLVKVPSSQVDQYGSLDTDYFTLRNWAYNLQT